MGLGHKVAVMVRLIGAAVNEGDRPHSHVAGRNDESWLRRPRPEPCKSDRTTHPAARQSNLWLQHCDNNQKRTEETMNIDRRQFALPVLALGLGLMSAVPAFAGADEDAVAKNVEAFRAAQA